MKKITRKIAGLASAGVIAVTGLASSAPAVFSQPVEVSAVDTNNDDWIHAEGSRLYDMNGNEVWLTGANWFGYNCTECALHYLWSGDIDDMVCSIADHGINVLRIPVSTELLYNWMIGNPDPMQSVNPNNDPYYPFNIDLINPDGSVMNSMESFDVLLAKCKKYGVKVFIDIHSPESNNSGHNYGLWYGKSFTGRDGKEVTVTTEIWAETLAWTAEHYKNDDTLIGFDLKNEPHSTYGGAPVDAIWDNSDAPNNWKKAAEYCADEILSKNPNALILIEGVQGYNGYNAWWGGNLRGVRDYPVTPESGTSQIIYSPHDYGPIVSDQPWFNKDFTEQTLLDDYWYDTWSYLVEEDIAPLLIGEWGGRLDGGDNEKWLNLLRDYMIKNHINHTFWCLNDDSGDTGGLWKDIQYSPQTGTTINWDIEKYEIFEPSLWQTNETGKYIGLDHQTALGKNGISVNDFYENYASSEGSNLDGGKTSSGKPVNTTKPEETTTTAAQKPTETTTSDKTETKPTETTTVTTSGGDVEVTVMGDANCDGILTIADATAIIQNLGNHDEYALSEQGEKNADCYNPGDGVTGKDALAIQNLEAKLISKLPVIE